MGFLDGLFEKKFDKPIAGPATIGRAVSGGWAGGAFAGYTMDTIDSRWQWDKAVYQAYGRVVWVFRAVHAISAAQASLVLDKKDLSTPEGHVVDDKNFYRLMNKKPNPYESAWNFRYRLSSQCMLSPLGAFIEVVRQGDTIKELYLLDPGTVTIIKDPRTFVKAYRVQRAGGAYDDVDPENIIWVKTSPHPADPYRNVTPLESAGLSVETDYYARMFNRNFLRKDGRPGMLIGVKGEIMPDDAEELKELFSGGFGSAGETRVIEADGMDVVDFSTKPRDAQWMEAIDNARDNILAAFGVPESVLGNASGRCLRASELVHLADGTILPAQELVGQEFNLIQPFNGGFRPIVAKASYAQHENVYKVTTFSGRTLEINGEHPLYMAVSHEKKGTNSYRSTKRDIFPYGWTALKEIKRSFDTNDRLRKGTYTEIAVPMVFDQQSVIDYDLDEAMDAGVAFEEVPDKLFSANLDAQKAFLTGVYTEHGRMSQHTGFDLYVPTREYARRLQILLMRIGVASYIGTKKMTHIVTISGFVNMRHFLDQVELHGKNAENASKVRNRIEVQKDDARQEGLLRTDGLPVGLIWDRIVNIEDLGEDDTVAITIDDARERHYLSTFWEHNTYNNAEGESATFWTNTMKTHCDAIADALEILTGSDDDDTYLEFDYSSVDVLQTANRRRLDQYRQDLNNGAINMNDYRLALGQDPIDEPYFRVYFFPNGAIGGADADVQHVMRQMLTTKGVAGQQNPLGNPFSQNAITGGDGTVGGFNDLVQGETALSRSDTSQTINDQAARTFRSANVNKLPAQAVNPVANSAVQSRVNDLVNRQPNKIKSDIRQVEGEDIHRDLRNKTIGFIEGSLEAWSNRQLSVVADRLNHTKVRKDTRHWEGGVATKDLDTDYIVDVEDWTQEITDTIVKGLVSTLTHEAQICSNNLKDAGVHPKNGSNFITRTDVDEIIDSVSEQLRKSVTQQSKLIQKHINVQDKAGFSITEMKETLRHPENFDRYNWITLLAKRISTLAIESMYDKLYANVDAHVTKTWRTSAKEAFRANHALLDGQQKSISEQFDANYGKLRFPTDILSSEGDNCSCWIDYRLEK